MKMQTSEESTNPYASQMLNEEDGDRPKLLSRRIARKMAFIFLWTVGFHFGVSMLFGFFLGFCIVLSQAFKISLRDDAVSLFGIYFARISVLFAPCGLILGLFGLLPGTRLRVKNGAVHLKTNAPSVNDSPPER